MNLLLVSDASDVARLGASACSTAIESAGAHAVPLDVAPERDVLPVTQAFATQLADKIAQGAAVTVVAGASTHHSPGDLLASLNDTFGGVSAAAEAISGADVRLACNEEVPYFAPASLSAPLSTSAATEQSHRLEVAHGLTKHLGQDVVNAALASSYAGSFAGCAAVLIAMGAAAQGSALAHFDGAALERHLSGCDVLVVVTELLDWRQLRNSLVTTCAEMAAQHLVPCLVATGSMDVGQRELSAIGVAGAYGCLDEPLTSDGELRRLPTADEWDKAAAKLARVWVRRA